MLSLQEISDRLEIQDLLTRYADAIDRRDWDLLDQVYTPDADVDYSAFGGLVGKYPEIKVWLAEALAVSPGYQHMNANMDIRLDGDKATGRIMCLNPMIMPGDQQPPQVGFFGLWYIDQYVRTAAGWRISNRFEERAFTHNVPEGVDTGSS